MMSTTSKAPMLALLLVLAGCSKGTEGKEKGACNGNGTCDDGLQCLSETCVKASGPGRLIHEEQKAAEELEEGRARLEDMQSRIKEAQIQIDAANAEMDEAFKDLEAATTDEEIAHAALRRKQAQAQLKAGRIALQALKEENLQDL